jgi:ribosomal protein S17E
MNKLNMSVNQVAGYLTTFNTREVENPSLNSSDYQDNRLPGVYIA